MAKIELILININVKMTIYQLRVSRGVKGDIWCIFSEINPKDSKIIYMRSLDDENLFYLRVKDRLALTKTNVEYNPIYDNLINQGYKLFDETHFTGLLKNRIIQRLQK